MGRMEYDLSLHVKNSIGLFGREDVGPPDLADRARTADFNYRGHVHHASNDDPQYEIKSDRTDPIAAHKGSALDPA